MGQHVVSSATGQGSESLGGTFTLTEVAGLVLTLATYATATGIVGLRRLHQQGWIGVGITPGGGPFVGVPVLTYWRYIEAESQTVPFPSNLAVLADTIYWDIFAGGEMLLEVDW